MLLSFRELVNNNPVQKLLTIDEFKKYREDVRKGSNEKGDDEAPPGLDEGKDRFLVNFIVTSNHFIFF